MKEKIWALPPHPHLMFIIFWSLFTLSLWRLQLVLSKCSSQLPVHLVLWYHILYANHNYNVLTVVSILRYLLFSFTLILFWKVLKMIFQYFKLFFQNFSFWLWEKDQTNPRWKTFHEIPDQHSLEWWRSSKTRKLWETIIVKTTCLLNIIWCLVWDPGTKKIR